MSTDLAKNPEQQGSLQPDKVESRFRNPVIIPTEGANTLPVWTIDRYRGTLVHNGACLGHERS